MKIIKKVLCFLGLHKWEHGMINSTITPIADRCKWCKIVRVFRLWGYTYHKDVKEVNSEI